MRYKGLLKDIEIGNPSLNMSRIVCAFLLHIQLLPELSTSKAMLSFTKKNISSFSGQRFEYPALFAFFKFIGGLACFTCNIFLTLYSDNPVDVVKDFVAVSIIAEVDNYMVSTVTADESVDIMKLYVSNKRLEMTDIDIWNTFIATHSLPEASKESIETGEFKRPLTPFKKAMLTLLLVMYRGLSIIYHVFFYYFAPFLVTILVFMAQSIQSYHENRAA